MKYRILISVFSILLAGVLFASGPDSVLQKDRSTEPGIGQDSEYVVNNAFEKGEILEYRVHYGWITAGKGVVEIQPNFVDLNGHKCYHVVSTARSAKSFDPFFKVRDRYETYIDAEKLVPWHFKRQIREGSFEMDNEIIFDHDQNKAWEVQNGVKNEEAYAVPNGIQDVVSAMYFARTQDYSNANPGDRFMFRNFVDRKVHDLEVEYLGKEIVKIGKMEYRCVKLKPLVQEGGIFEHEGDMYLWISDDENRIPIRIESAVVIGSIKVDLISAKNLKNPFKSRIR